MTTRIWYKDEMCWWERRWDGEDWSCCWLISPVRNHLQVMGSVHNLSSELHIKMSGPVSSSRCGAGWGRFRGNRQHWPTVHTGPASFLLGNLDSLGTFSTCAPCAATASLLTMFVSLCSKYYWKFPGMGYWFPEPWAKNKFSFSTEQQWVIYTNTNWWTASETGTNEKEFLHKCLFLCSLKKMRSPILFLYSEDDPFVPSEVARQVKALFFSRWWGNVVFKVIRKNVCLSSCPRPTR